MGPQCIHCNKSVEAHAQLMCQDKMGDLQTIQPTVLASALGVWDLEVKTRHDIKDLEQFFFEPAGEKQREDAGSKETKVQLEQATFRVQQF